MKVPFLSSARSVVVTIAATLAVAAGIADAQPKAAEVEQAMKRAARFMVEEVSYKGGYVWSYLPDFSRRWGELEARETMIWVQPPGTATMGHSFLDAYHATGDEYYYQAAEKAARALIWGQHPSGGWNYLIDFAGEASLKSWYETIGKSGWRLEEFHHYYGNATFDDGGTAESAKFLLRLYMEKLDPTYKPALEHSLEFVLKAQYPVGGWPQRFPLRYDYSRDGKADYTSYITFNDDVALENIEFLIMCYQALGETRALDPIIRAMNVFLATQMGQPQPGWAMQYTTDLQPAGARSYEPKALSPATTASNIQQLMLFYRMTGESKFLARIPEALDWLDSVRLPKNKIRDGRTHPTFVEIGTGNTLYLHREGSNAFSGNYFISDDPNNTLSHYGSTRYIDVDQLRSEYKQLTAMPVEEATANSPLKAKTKIDLPRYFTLKEIQVSDLNSRSARRAEAASNAELVASLLGELNAQGYWPTLLRYTTNPYIGPGPKEPTPGNFADRNVGDKWDTSPFRTGKPVTGISTGVYIKNMAELIRYLDRQ